jgi:hypothetical protein
MMRGIWMEVFLKSLAWSWGVIWLSSNLPF